VSLERHRTESKHPLRFAVITISDTRDSASDRGGPLLVERLEAAGHAVTMREIVKDDADSITDVVSRAARDANVDLVLTTGGTGIAPRDVTYPTLVKLFESDIPGFGELFRALSFQAIGSAALLSRAVGGIVGGKVVLALPGSPKALELALTAIILPEAGHLVSQSRPAPL